jgi:hypothetical protein
VQAPHIIRRFPLNGGGQRGRHYPGVKKMCTWLKILRILRYDDIIFSVKPAIGEQWFGQKERTTFLHMDCLRTHPVCFGLYQWTQQKIAILSAKEIIICLKNII